MVALLMAVTVATAGALAFLSKLDYTATATVIAKGESKGFDKTLNFNEVVSSNSLALRVQRELNETGSVDKLASRINVQAGRSNLYKISVSDKDPQRAVVLANAASKQAAALYQELAAGTKTSVVKDLEKDSASFGSQYLKAAKDLLQFNLQHPDAVGLGATSRDVDVRALGLQAQLDERAAADAYLRFQSEVTRARVDELTAARNFAAGVVDEAVAKPDQVGRYLKVIYAAILALVLGIGMVLVLEYFDNSVREPEAVEELVGVPVIGVIPRVSSRTLRTVGARSR
jgi:capsular polysaccharide biosynthesis protein